MPTLMLPVYKNNNDWLEGFDVFVIEMTPELASSYLDAMDDVALNTVKLKHKGISLYQFRCWDYNGQWFPGDFDADPVINGEYGDECQPPLHGAESSRTEGDVVLISEQSIEWEAIPKHAETDVSTASLSRAQLEQIAAPTPTQIKADTSDIELDVLNRLRNALGDEADGLIKNMLEAVIRRAYPLGEPEKQ